MDFSFYYIHDDTLVLKTNKCSQNCIFCPEILYLSSESLDISIFEILKDNPNIIKIEFSGGESLLDKSLYDLLVILSTKYEIILKTNLSTPDRLLAVLSNHTVHEIKISWPGVHLTSCKITQSNFDFDIFLASFNILMKTYRGLVTINLNVAKETYRIMDIYAILYMIFSFAKANSFPLSNLSFNIRNFSKKLDYREDLTPHNTNDLKTLLNLPFLNESKIYIS